MADRYLLESGSPDGYLLEDGTGVELLNTGVVWDWDNSSHYYTLSSDGLTATSGVDGDQMVKANTTLTSGFYTVTPNMAFGGNSNVGFNDLADAATGNWVGTGTNSTSYGSNGTIYSGGTTVGTSFATYTTADVIKAEITGGKAFFYKNGTLQNTGGTTLPAGLTAPYPAASTNKSGNVLVADFTGWAVSGSPALTGQSLTGTIGSILAAASLALSGGGLTSSLGSVGVLRAPTITGQSVAAAQGSSVSSVTVALTGQSLSVGQGSVGLAAGLTGQSLSVAQASVGVTRAPALTGQSLSAAQGSVAPATAAATTGQSTSAAQGSLGLAAGLTGQSLSVARGTVAPATTAALTGQSDTAAQGSVTASSSSGATAALTGQSTTAAQGSALASSSVALTGQGVSAARGTVTAVTGATASLTGQSLSASSGSLASSVSLALTGQPLTATRGTVTVGASSSVTLALTGQSVSAAQGAIGGRILGIYWFICTNAAYPAPVPVVSGSQKDFNRKAANALAGLGKTRHAVGDLVGRPISNPVNNHLLCDGSAVSRTNFPQLFAEIGTTWGAGDGVTTFNLPNLLGPTLPNATTAPTQTIADTTVSTGGAITEPITPAQSGGGRGGNYLSGGITRFDING